MTQYEFYRDVQLEDDGAVKVISVAGTGDIIVPGSEYEFFRLLELDDDGRIKIYIQP